MTRTLRRALVSLAAACAAAFLLASCASMQRGADQGVVRQVAGLINAGDTKALATMSVTPFLVDGEIVPLAADIAAFWDGIVRAGFKVDGAALDVGTAVSAESFTQFAPATEVKFWFSRYARDARVISLTASGGRHVLLVARPDWFTWKLLGFKGPF